MAVNFCYLRQCEAALMGNSCFANFGMNASDKRMTKKSV
jgi:hypothetical protein